jgi:hypothetical protein
MNSKGELLDLEDYHSHLHLFPDGVHGPDDISGKRSFLSIPKLVSHLSTQDAPTLGSVMYPG